MIIYLGAWFGAPEHIRLSYALDEAEIEAGLERIRTCLGELEGEGAIGG